jgi:CelD/BcsL family acetyltransferase involved in cellulose biosynthesis
VAIRSQVVEDLGALEQLRDEWDALAVQSRLALAAPAFTLAALRHLTPRHALVRTVVVRDGDRLAGIAPLVATRGFLGRWDYRLAAADVLTRIAPLAAPGRADVVAAAIARTLAQAEPEPYVIQLDGFPLAGPAWPSLLTDRWPGRLTPPRLELGRVAAPAVGLHAGSFDAWMAGRSANFRSQMRRARRKLGEAGGRVRRSTAQTLRADLEALLRLHSERFAERGDSTLTPLGGALVDALEEAARALLEAERVRIFVVEVGDRPAAVQLFAAAGGESTYWNGGWDEEFADLKPSMLAILEAIEDAFGRGERMLDLGAGQQDYKLRFSDRVETLQWAAIVPHSGLRSVPLVAGHAARWAARRRLSEDQWERLRGARRALTTIRRPGG